MLIEQVHIIGFRNFVDEIIPLASKILIVGGNDTGKTNLLHALRILFDPTLSSRDFELSDSDFNVQSSADEVIITAWLKGIDEACLISSFKGALEGGCTVVRFRALRDGTYSFYTGAGIDNLNETPARTYIRNLQLEYVGSNRDLSSFLCRQQGTLLEISRAQRDDTQADEDEVTLHGIQESLDSLNTDINGLHYIEDALKVVNDEMGRIAASNEGYQARFVAGSTDAGKLVGDLHLSYLSGNAPLTFGGDGRGNQLYFATWLSEQKLKHAQEKVVIYAIEEPEAHLHPQQQRRLAEYLSTSLPAQVLITSHSPQIIDHFTDGEILRLGPSDEHGRDIASGCSVQVDKALDSFGYRLNSISAETFFSDGVFLVEGTSERIFYFALAVALGLNFDRLNLSVLSVEGIGFKPYVDVCKALGIPWVLRTDNDIFVSKDKKHHRAAGFLRAIGIAEYAGLLAPDEMSIIDGLQSSLKWGEEMPTDLADAEVPIRDTLRTYGIFLSEVDLEHDLATSALSSALNNHYKTDNADDLVHAMQVRKAENMHAFITDKPELALLANDPLAQPLYALVKLATKSARDA